MLAAWQWLRANAWFVTVGALLIALYVATRMIERLGQQRQLLALRTEELRIMRRYSNRIDSLDKESASQVAMIESTKTKQLQGLEKERQSIQRASDEGAEAMATKLNEVFAKRKQQRRQ